MNGINKIIEHIKSESAAQCKAIEQGAQEECARIREQYAKAEQDEYWKAVNDGTKEIERRLERLTSLAMLESKKMVLATQQEMVNAAFELAVRKLSELPDEEYAAFLVKLACNASLTGTELIMMSQSDSKRFGKEVLNAANAALKAAGRPASLRLSETAVNIRGGLILSGGDIESNCSIEALIAEYRNDLAPRVASELFD